MRPIPKCQKKSDQGESWPPRFGLGPSTALGSHLCVALSSDWADTTVAHNKMHETSNDFIDKQNLFIEVVQIDLITILCATGFASAALNSSQIHKALAEPVAHLLVGVAKESALLRLCHGRRAREW